MLKSLYGNVHQSLDNRTLLGKKLRRCAARAHLGVHCGQGDSGPCPTASYCPNFSKHAISTLGDTGQRWGVLLHCEVRT